ncbi:hypothetical protein PPERSA_01764 [Pseudocohnilembus persalinus]|uniref:Derlin n=1 Tax=Pseudocohnilembus persalinus TaxID=266149 RepID=A0A0V0R1A3_PSEPJ|nr:hypothetical protein PPERSA_01764 [Pseudocohnilembus persalinus]|eukprot:KRX08303.1 hypothetical protein PPERSA_01764 [Pseudocohnilembus persalinus]
MDDFKVWYNQQPFLSRTYLTCVILTTTVVSFGIISPYHINLDLVKVFSSVQIWRLITNFFFVGTFSFNIIFALFFLHFAISRIESLYSKRNYADLLYLILFTMITLDIVGMIFSAPFLISGFQIVLIYIWCKRRPLEIVQFLFGIRIKSAYFPFFLVGFHLLTGQNVLIDVIGLAIGHVYIFLKDIYPQQSHKDYLRTPLFFQKLVDKYIIPLSEQHNYQNVQRNDQPQAGNVFRAFQGRGVRIG